MTLPAEILESVSDDEALWRRIHRDQYVSDGQGGMRVSSGAFIDPRLSVDRASVLSSIGRDYSYTRRNGVGVAEFTAGIARGLEQEVVPDAEPDNPAHALVIGDKRRGNRRVAKSLADASIFRTA